MRKPHIKKVLGEWVAYKYRGSKVPIHIAFKMNYLFELLKRDYKE